MLAVLLATTAANAQQSFHPKTVVVDPEEGVPGYKRKFLPPDGWMSPDDRRILAISRATIEEAKRVMPPPPPAPVPERIVITYGGGGLVDEHNGRFYNYRNAGNAVEIRGPCLSACTLITAHIPKERLCFAAGAYLAFHAARSVEKHENMPLTTGVMYRQQPPEIRNWIDRTGGWENLPLDGFWYLRDRELWEMGYPRCK